MGVSRRSEQAMTLVELMVAMTVLATVIGWVLVAFTNQQRSQLDHERVVEAQHEGRLITDLLVSDLRLAGFMMPGHAAVASNDGGNGASDVICMSDPSVIDSTLLGNQNQRYPGADGSAVANGAGSVTVAAGDLDVDGDATDDFQANSGIIISDGVNVHCAQIAPGYVGGTAIPFAPPTTAAFSGIDTVVVPALFYEVIGTDLSRNGTALSTQVEDIQIEYWVDANADGQMDLAEFPIHDLAGNDLDDLRLARVSVTSRSSRNDSQLVGNNFSAVANRVAGPADNFKRRRAIAETLLRNVR